MRTLTHLLVAAALAGPAFAGGTTVDFESDTLGWIGPSGTGGATFLDAGAGAGGSTGLHTVFNDFGITFRNSANPAYLGDLASKGTVTISIDTLVNQVSFFGSPVSRPWLVELRDYDLAQGGYPWTSVWYLFDDISAGPGYTTYAVTIADTTSTTLPAGWGGYGDEDALANPILPDGVTFTDVLAGVDEIAFTTLQPGFFFGFTDFDVVVDNITISYPDGDPWTDLGGGTVGANGPDTLAGTGTLVGGSPTNLTLTGAPSNALTLGWVSFAPTPMPAIGGTLHAFPFSSQFFFGADAAGSVAINVPWPAGLPSGTEIWFQFLADDPSSIHGITMSNGLKATSP